MKLSLVIPTRERADYLKSAIKSAVISAENADCSVEIIVSDNASADNMPEIVAGLDGPDRFTKSGVSTFQNFINIHVRARRLID